ncbi:indolepyruvate ferredoxin oxidoreductase family protein [Azospira restricta]|uniref:Indolepyruvate ferredoxin oxidoreductase family protein n=1 Tax=Azospira restricta TaxID=404405 RepID=A0A974SR33_9RHOO|nr:indolepyruvate ferredoxin oxidoreductase family protein [Azospira restricta]QRJ64882.1 indolepyruvate ferredoxin oxidoreductase family protein [Azospira restricta]
MSDLSITLEDKYTRASGRVFLTGSQALVRLPLLQRQRDAAAGLNTAGFVSGYRGSPLGGVDQAFWAAKKILEPQHIVFQPGVNEDLAATAVWGSQQVNLFPGAKYDGVFGMWYGKGPGVDRCGDVFRHANAAGTSPHGGVLVIAGDDHNAKSSTLPHQTDHFFKAVMMPVLYPANVQEYLDYGLHGWAMSRYSGCWVALKALADTVETSASVDIDPLSLPIVTPTDFELPEGGLNIRWPDDRHEQERRLLHHKLYAALAYARANRLNRVVIDSPAPRLGIITAGKSYLDVRQAFDELGIDDALAAEIGIRLYKVGMVWPLEADGVREFAEGLEEILVIEEKRQLIEYQLKEELYNWREDVRPRVIGKFDEKGEWASIPDGRGHVTHGEWLLPAAGELSVAHIARVIAARIERFFTSPHIQARLALIEAKQRAQAAPIRLAQRTPTFCSGCPHNTSTRVPEGSRAVAGIGCHYMVTWMDRSTGTFTHMGGEGVPWVGQAPFTAEKHIFANLGDGTYFHSGLLAIRQAVSAGHPITYKILYNDAVAMTGGQPVDGTLTVPQMTRQLEGEGIEKIVIVTDEPEKYAGVGGLALIGGKPIPIRHRDELDAVQRELREYPSVSILIYDQTCATEKRRRRKRGKLADPAKRVFINEAVCEGCGDCGVQSNCLSIVPVETEFGRKRQIDQSSCNKDFSCLKGFCPSFVTIEGGQLRKPQAISADEAHERHFADLPLPAPVDTGKPFNILVTGVGGTGVVTIGALIGMAAHIDGKGVSVLDMTGLAQKFGAVYSHLRIADRPADIHAARIATGEADAIVGGDLVVSAGNEAISKTLAGKTRAVVNLAETPTAEFTTNPDWQFPLDRMEARIVEACGEGNVHFVDAQQLAVKLMGDAIFANTFLLGMAWQKGLVPVSLAAIEKAFELNGTAVAQNHRAFLWGRRAAHDLAAVRRFAEPAAVVPLTPAARGLDEIVARRAEILADYQDAAYAARYRALVERVRTAEAALGGTALAEAVARYYFKLLAIKDEYEVARLYADPAFLRRIEETFAGDYRLVFHLAPPLVATTDPNSGHPRKQAYGPWMLRAFRLLAKLRFLRGTAFDVFGKTAERRMERQLIADYEADVALIVDRLSAATLADAVALASVPERIRGFGHVKAAHVAAVAGERERLRNALRANAKLAAAA